MELILKRKLPLTVCNSILNYKINENIIHTLDILRIEKKKGPKEKAITKVCWSEKCNRIRFKLDSVNRVIKF